MANVDPPMDMAEALRLIGLGNDNMGLEDAIKQQMAQAQFMREGGVPEMRHAGRVSVAPHWMELLGGLARQKVAGDLTKSASSDQAKMRGNTLDQNNSILRAIMQQQAIQQPPGGTGILPGASGQGMQPPPNFQF